jgi:hypothetical protein
MTSNVLASRRASEGTIPSDLIILFLWSMCGLALNGLLFVAGYGAEIAEALAVAG